MVSINLGSIVNSDGKSQASGISSNLNTSEIIDSLTEARRLPAVDLEEDISSNANKVTAYSELRTIAENLKTAVDFLRNVPGFNKESSNLFDYRTASTSSSTLASPESYVSVTANAGATEGTFDIAVSQIATAKSQRSDAFSSQTGSITEASGGTTSGMFSAGTFTIASTLAASASDKLSSSDYRVEGSGSGILTAGGIHNITTSGDGSTALKGGISGFSAVLNSGDNSKVDLSVNIGGEAFSATEIPTTGGDITAGTMITLSNGDGTSFDIEIASNVTIAANQTNADSFAANLDSALSAQVVHQNRQLENFDRSALSSPLTGMSAEDIYLSSDGFESDGTHGAFGAFSVSAVSGVGMADGSISVRIGDETYEATGLGSDADDTHTGNLTLTSTTTGKELHINIADAGVTLDFSSDESAANLQSALSDALSSKAQDITIAEGDSLVDIASSINAQKAITGVSASIIQVSDSDFRLTLQSDNTGRANAFQVIDDAGVVGDVNFTGQQTAQDAVFSINGLEINRPSNTADDVIDGLSVSLIAATPDYGTPAQASTTVAIGNDTEAAEAGIINFVNAYNEFRAFAEQQTSRDENGQYDEDASLGDETLLGNMISKLENEINRAVGGVSDGNFSKLSDLGITFTDFEGDAENPPASNILTYDPTALSTAVANNFDKVREIFEFSFNASSADLSVFSRSNQVTLTDFKLDIDMTRDEGDQVRVLDMNDNLLFNADITASGSAYKISGADGTDIEGLEMIYSGGDTQTTTVGLSAGIAERSFNVLNDILKDGGTMEQSVEFITEEDTRLQSEIDRIDEQIEIYRNILITQFTAMESAISRVNTLLEYISTQNEAVFSS